MGGLARAYLIVTTFILLPVGAPSALTRGRRTKSVVRPRLRGEK